MGRELRADAPSRTKTVRLSPEESRRLKLAASVHGQRPSEFIREAIMDLADERLDARRREA